MNTHSTILDNVSTEATTSDRILQIVLAAWRQRNFVAVVNQFSDQFTFTDHALGLEFKDKGRLTEFLAKIRELFPDSERRDNTIFSNGDRVISEWTLTATTTEPFLEGRLRKVPISVPGISVVQIKNGRISQWSDYYDQLKSRPGSLSGLSSDRSGFSKLRLIDKAFVERDPKFRVIKTDGRAACPPSIGQAKPEAVLKKLVVHK
jgi:steroid delta-isomerase-like uncharacterized protein